MTLSHSDFDLRRRWRRSDLRIIRAGNDVRIIGPCGLDRILSPNDARAVALALREFADEAECPITFSSSAIVEGRPQQI